MLIKYLQSILETSSLAAPGDSVLVAFSGGPDSTALLHALFSLRGEFDLEISAAHLNHGLRGRDSDGDQLFCFEFCRALDIPFLSRKTDVMAETGSGDNLEETAREVRYAFLREAAQELGADRIATAHTADDQVETILHRLVRGAGISGLRGIPERRGQIIRPLLGISREDVEDYLHGHNISSRHDAHNDDRRFTRVFLRSEVVPLLKELNPSLSRTLAASASILADEDDFLEELAEEITSSVETREEDDHIELPLGVFTVQHPAMQRRILRRIFMRFHGDTRTLESRQIEAIMELAAGEAPGMTIRSIRIQREEDKAALSFKALAEETAEQHSYLQEHSAPGHINLEHAGLQFVTSIMQRPENLDIAKLSGPNKAVLDADKTGSRLRVRSWQPGDRYRQTGAEGRQKLQDIFVNAKLPAEEKLYHPVFEADGEIIWVYGFRVAEEYKVRNSTQRLLLIEKENRDETSH